MLNQKCFCLPLWVWLVAIGVAVYFYCYSPTNKLKSKPKEEKKEKKEKFANSTISKLKIFNFYTSWCGWSVKFQPEWNEFAKAVKADSKLSSKVDVIDVKCDNPENEKLCEKYQVPGYPYVVVDNNGKHEAYSGERTAKALLSFVSSK
jgi:thiol-disulfide isomerase/thioredoxin